MYVRGGRIAFRLINLETLVLDLRRTVFYRKFPPETLTIHGALGLQSKVSPVLREDEYAQSEEKEKMTSWQALHWDLWKCVGKESKRT